MNKVRKEMEKYFGKSIPNMKKFQSNLDIRVPELYQTND
jgi:hypothetical protein